MDKDILKGIKFAFGIFIFFGFILGIVYGVGFHTPNEILSGTFSGNYNFTGNVTGVIPYGFIGAFSLPSCPTGWVVADGGNSTPDLRGRFIRGLDLGAGVDPGRVLGTYQADEFASHTHGIPYDGGGVTKWNFNSRAYAPSDGGGSGIPTDPRGGTETRPKNIALIYCMKI